MKKIYSLLLTAAALLVGTNAWAGNVAKIGSTEYATLEAAWAAVQDGQTIELIDNCQPQKTLWLGTETMADEANVKSITLDLAGKNIIFDFSVSKPAFFITHGSLNITGTGTISLGSVGEGGYSLKAQTVGGVQTTNASHWVVFQVTGSTYKTVDPSDKDADHYTHLTIGENVTVDCQGIGIVVDRLVGTAKAHQWPLDSDPTGKYAAVATSGVNVSAEAFNTNVYTGTPAGLAYGVRVDMKGHIIAGKYGIKANTELAGPSSNPKTNVSGYVVNFDEDGKPIAYTDETKAFDKTYSPYIKIHDGATVTEVNTTTGGIAAVYSGGYARWQIEGDCKGSTGAFIKSGEVVVAGDAKIESNYENPYTAGGDSGLDRGFEGGGSGLVVVSSDLGVGDTKVTITEDATIKGATGYAIEEGISTSDGHSEVESIAIQGGTIEQGANGQGIITVTTETRGDNTSTTVTISGGTFEGDENGVTLGSQSLQDFLETQRERGEDTHGVIVYVDPVTNEQTVVISPGPAPIVANSVIAAAANTSINWINSGTPTETLVADKKLAELQISQDYAQKLIVSDGVTLEVGRVVLGAKAQIVVEAGGKFIVSGEQGLAAFQESNLILKNDVVNNEVKRAIFLFHPAVTQNTHPKAIYQLTTDSWRVSSTESQAEVFGVPTYQAITSIGCTTDGKYGYIQRYGQNGTWENIAFTDDNPFPYDQLNKPFAAYAITAYRAQDDPKLTFEFGGELYGNSNASLNSTMKWSFFANSYTAEIDLATFLAGLEENAQNVDKFVYVSTVMANGHWRWDAIGTSLLGTPNVATKLQPMQGFLLNNKGGKVEANAIDYASMVYAPAVPSNDAPRRGFVANDNTANLFIIATREDGAYDNVKIRENAEAESCEKFMNEDVNIYATAEEKSAILAAENLEDTYVGFSTVKGGNFTISFANVAGREFDLIDLETGAKVAVAEGETYSFSAAANYTNDYRFKLVAPAKMPTAIENTEVKANAKGIFTLTGQFVGEMNVWNTLPAGVYVVNGAKRVK